MPLAKRYHIERLTGTRTEYYDGCETPRYDGFSPDREDAELFRSEAKAQRRADRVGGEVYATTVMVSLALDGDFASNPYHPTWELRYLDALPTKTQG